MDFLDREDADGIRVTWSNVPKSKLQHQRNVVPLTALYTPLNTKLQIAAVPESLMMRCRQCRAFAHPYVQMDSDRWVCLYCSSTNPLMKMQSGEWHPALQHTSIEFVTERRAPVPPIFLYVVDTCFEGEDILEAYEALRSSLLYSVMLLPSDALVGIISFGRHVQLHDLHTPLNSVVFNGLKKYALDEIRKLLRMETVGYANGKLGPVARRFLAGVEVVEYELNSIFELLTNNIFKHGEFERPARATGCAMNIAASLLQAILGKDTAVGGHIMCFIGGAVTVGPGKVVDIPKKEPIRSHHDIEKSKASQLPNISNGVAKVNPLLWTEARLFYSEMATVLCTLGIAMNLFIGSYDQAGLHEMAVVCSKTGGSVVMCDSFNTSLFKQSVIKFFARKSDTQDPENEGAQESPEDDCLLMAYNGQLECRTNKDLQVQGLIGHASAIPLRKDNFTSVSPIVVGEGNTNAWKLCSVNPQSTYALYFDKLDSQALGSTHLQFTFFYQHPSGEHRIRVTTLALGVIADTDAQALLYGFDADAALVAIARSQIEKLYAPGKSMWALTFDSSDLNKHLDRLIIDYCAQFGHYTKGEPASFLIADPYFDLANKLYHLRRSPFIRVFNSSPDETSFYHHVLMHEEVYNACIMIKPSLLSYDMDTYGQVGANGETIVDPIPVELDSSSLGPTKILLLDTFFQILIYHGKTIAAWRKADYQNQEGYEYFKEFLNAPRVEALYILADRFPLPRFIDCDEGGSQARFLIARLNSSTTYSTDPNSVNNTHDILTDDASLAEFMDRLKRNIVGSKKAGPNDKKF